MKPLRRRWIVTGAITILACTNTESPLPPAAKLTFTVQPSNAAAGVPISPAVAVAIEDSFGHVVTSATHVVTLTLGPGGGVLAGPAAVSAVNGVATFSALSVDKAGTGYALTAAAPGLAAATSTAFDIAVGPAARLAFTVQPSNANVGATIAPAVQVTARDAGGNTATGFTGNVTVAIGTNAGVGTLSGTTTVQAVAGVASFADLSIHKAGTGYTLTAVSGVLTAGTSAPFTIAPVPTALHITTTTTGMAVPTGYSLCVDAYSGSYSGSASGCGWSGPIGANSAVTVPVPEGSHSVELDGVPGNCALTADTANPRIVTASGTTDVPFSVACLDTGSVHVTVTTTGTDLDQNGYVVCVNRAANNCVWGLHVLANDVASIGGVTAEPHTVSIGDVVGNCTVSGALTQAVTVPAHGAADVRFAIQCVAAERIAFSSPGTITVARLDGVSTVSVTHGFAPAWSADGTRLAYECDQDICAINPDGSSFAQLTTNAASNRHPTWSPDGSKIAFSVATGGVPDLWVMAADGSGAVRLTQGVGFVGSPAWSPDGTKIAFDCQVDAANDDICVVNADGTGFARLTNDPARDYGAAWERDGSTLAFATTRFGAGAAEIVLMSSTGGAVTRIGAGLPGSEPTWSPDGSQLAFVRFDPFRQAFIFAAHTDGTNVITITSGDGPAWKPHP
ncbi:MAG TPA: hypothetical protein VEU73_07910 [Gemmatimonadales bacterium]|nr:hypothetical protein [Gemmatimonadales bacterium]